MNIRSLPWPLLALVLALAPRAAAQDPQQVLKDFKAVTKQTLKDLKVELKDAGDVLDVGLDDFAARFDELAGSDAPVEDLVDDLVDFQVAVWTAQNAALDTVGGASTDALASLPDGGADDNVLPKGLLGGDGGTLDDAVAALNAAVTKAGVSPAKKVAKLAKKLRAKTDMRLSVVLHAMQPIVLAPGEVDFGAGPDSTLSIDLLVGFDRGGVEDDARFWASGAGGFSQGMVSVIVQGPTVVALSDTPDALEGRWRVDNESPAEPAGEGNYFFYANQNSGAGSCGALGIP